MRGCLLRFLEVVILVSAVHAVIDHTIPTFKRGKVEIVDETALTNPESFDYDFSEDLSKPADKQDLYDQFIAQLPMFNLYKLGHDRGQTKVPIVTRSWETWFTPSTVGHEAPFKWFPTTPMPSPRSTESSMVETESSPITTTPMPTTTTIPTTTTVRATAMTTTQVATTTTTMRTTPRWLPRTPPRQPPPVFRTFPPRTTTTAAPFNRGPVWRQGTVAFETTTTPRIFTRNFFTRRPIVAFTTTQAPTTSQPRPVTSGGRWIAGPRRVVSGWRRPMNQLEYRIIGHKISSQTTTRPVDHISQTQPKPVIIQNPVNRYSGPTYNCRVLNPFVDGQASAEHDDSCRMLYPGLSLDGSCRCYYKVAGRDSHGCATGFIYACRPPHVHSVAV